MQIKTIVFIPTLAIIKEYKITELKYEKTISFNYPYIINISIM